MDIRITSRPEKIWYEIDSQIGALLCAALPSVFEKVEKPAPKVALPTVNAQRFVARLNPLWGTPEVVWIHMNQQTAYPGRPGITPTVENARAAFAAAGHPVPDDVLQKFSALLEAAKSSDPDVVRDVRERLQNEQFSREQKERAAQQKLSTIGE